MRRWEHVGVVFTHLWDLSKTTLDCGAERNGSGGRGKVFPSVHHVLIWRKILVFVLIMKKKGPLGPHCDFFFYFVR